MAITIWQYPKCLVLDVYDGDTIRVDIDLGQDIWVKNRSVRLTGIACRELREPGGKEARDALRLFLPVGSQVHIYSTGWDKYAGRIDGDVYKSNPDMDLVQRFMINEGWAVPWDGRGPQPKPVWPKN